MMTTTIAGWTLVCAAILARKAAAMARRAQGCICAEGQALIAPTRWAFLVFCVGMLAGVLVLESS